MASSNRHSEDIGGATDSEDGLSSSSPAVSEKRRASRHSGGKRLRGTFSADYSDLIGQQPAAQARRRDVSGERDLRPSAAPSSYSRGLGKKMTQQQIYQAQLKYSVTPSEISALWERLEARVDARVQEIAADPDGCIPEVDIDDILSDKVDAETIARLRVSGVIKIRRTVEREVAERLNRDIMADLVAYFGVDPERPETYTAIYNDTDPKTFTFGGVQEMYYTRAQQEARENARLTAAREWLNKIWNPVDEKSGQLQFLPEFETTYVDRWRHRLPRYPVQTGMKEHIDNGGFCRWADPAWQQTYRHIMRGNFEKYDPWAAGGRTKTSGSHFRSFQGWLALTPQGPRDGTLEVVPMLKDAMAYILLRPFLQDVPAHQFCGVNETSGGLFLLTRATARDGARWFGWLGADSSRCLYAAAEMLEITSRWHAPILRGKVSVGFVEPGDSVWWHPDIIHSVESEHVGIQPSNVLYIPAAPLCPQNARYLCKQRQAFHDGIAPPDFPQLFVEQGSARRATQVDLSQHGRRQMGMEAFPASALRAKDEEDSSRRQELLAECNRILFPESGPAHTDTMIQRGEASADQKPLPVEKMPDVQAADPLQGGHNSETDGCALVDLQPGSANT